MHPAPSLAEAPPKTDEPRMSLKAPASPGSRPHSARASRASSVRRSLPPPSPPARKDTGSSTSTNSTSTSRATVATSETVPSAYSNHEPVRSPNYSSSHAVFSIKDGSDASANRRASRRRTGPLSAVQRERAALIRKLGACSDCRRRRVACHPNHHNMTWEDAARKYRSHSPNIPGLSPVSGRPLSPATMGAKAVYQDPREMDVDDDAPAHQHQPPGRPPMNEARVRTPLPSGPRLDKPASAAPPPSADCPKPSLQSAAARILADPYGSRYTSVQALLLYWQEDDDPTVRRAVDELAQVFESSYQYTFKIKQIPSSPSCKNSERWLSREINEFIEHNDQRDVLKIVYYNGHSYLDGDRDMTLASSTRKKHETSSTIRWGGIQQVLEGACSDTLVLMDAAYYPSSKLVRRQGVLELIAASAGEDHVRLIERNAFTRSLTEALLTRAGKRFANPLSAAELHARLLSAYPKIIRDRQPEREVLTSFPSPLHVQISGDSRLPSILLAPVRRKQQQQPAAASLALDPTAAATTPPPGGPQLGITLRLADDGSAFNTDAWAEWLRIMPDGVRDIKVDGPYRNHNTLR